ncbi:hypothetical protein BDF20DRAFT_852346 [Mycotypha africana]|uniref:uncharacterized protein n=1 Tax=Mycotypha africana TaxID=64632 RepID=UPI0023013A13|nr:uncharacterized protein BDF20DRAFT_852346 [Mycotypha africana]KAI8987814.1 hypothetical protein BDF20DRAFT_852346 [Mycotypha africana]
MFTLFNKILSFASNDAQQPTKTNGHDNNRVHHDFNDLPTEMMEAPTTYHEQPILTTVSPNINSNTTSAFTDNGINQFSRGNITFYHNKQMSTELLPVVTDYCTESPQQTILHQQRLVNSSRPYLPQAGIAPMQYSNPNMTASTSSVGSQEENAKKLGLSSSSLASSPPPSYTKQIKNKVSSMLGYSNENKEQRPNIDKEGLLRAVELAGIAVDEFEEGNEATGLDIYLIAFDKMIMAIPKLQDENSKQALADKLKGLGQQFDFMLSDKQNSNDEITSKLTYTAMEKEEGDESSRRTTEVVLHQYKTLGLYLTNVISQWVVRFKQSRIPGLLYMFFTLIMHSLLSLNQHLHLTEMAKNLIIYCTKTCLKLDDKYKLHEFLTEATFTIIKCTLDTVVAYLEAPSYAETRKAAKERIEQEH